MVVGLSAPPYMEQFPQLWGEKWVIFFPQGKISDFLMEQTARVGGSSRVGGQLKMQRNAFHLTKFNLQFSKNGGGFPPTALLRFVIHRDQPHPARLIWQ
jgi:hypothetical protein